MKLSFSQWVTLGFGGLRLMQMYRQNVPVQTIVAEAGKVSADVFPDAPLTEPAITHTEVVNKIRTGSLSQDEQAHFDRATQDFGAG